MSETTTERPTVNVVGIITGIIQKKADTWQVAVKPEGSEYTKNLWTKDADLIESLSARIGQQGGFICGSSTWTNQSGQEVKSLWINAVASAAAMPTLTAGNAPAQQGQFVEAQAVDWDAKERRDFRSRAWAQTISAFQHTIKTDETPNAVFIRLQEFQRLVYQDVCGMFAYPEDGSDLPFEDAPGTAQTQ